MNRIREGYLCVQNPFNAHKYTKVSLSNDSVDAIVFWTKNPYPLLKYLDELSSMGYKYYFQFTVTGYPSIIESSVPKFEDVVSVFKQLSIKIGKDKVIWRFDPIIISDITPEEYIIASFKKIARILHSYTDRVVISFADYYKKVVKNLNVLEHNRKIKFYDISSNINQIKRISSFIAEIAQMYSLHIFSCSEEYDLSYFGIEHGKCIDDDLLSELFGFKYNFVKDKNQRQQCGCVKSQDIGQYNSCIHDCIYCYANDNKTLAHKNKLINDPSSPFLIGNNVLYNEDTKIKEEQLSLF